MSLCLNLLGGAALEADGKPVTGRAAHKRRIAILALLACARGRALGREKVIGYLWPEHPTDAARHLLSESLYVLRKELGDDAFVAVGDEVGLNGAVVGSDVSAFEGALERKAYQEAVEAYRGPFLDGFYVSDAPEFERWADAERARLARSWSRAIESLAEQAEAAGDVVPAVEWWRRLAGDDPANSRVALRLMRALDASGQRAAAIRYAAMHADFLRDEYGTPADADVEAFAARLRSIPSPAPNPPIEPLPRPALPPQIVSPSTATPAVVIARAANPVATIGDARDRGVDRSPGRAANRRSQAARGALAATAVFSLVALARSMAGPPLAAGTDASYYVVLPFASPDSPGAESEPLTPEGAELLLHDALGRWRDVRLVDAMRAQDAARRSGPVRTLEDAMRAARAVGAGKLVWGEFAKSGESIVVEGAVYDVVGGGTTVRRSSVRVSRDLRDAQAKFRALSQALLGASGAGEDEGGTLSLAAEQDYQEGRVALARWDLERAHDALARASAADPNFAEARLWLAQVTAWSGGAPAQWKDDAGRAVADGSSLSTHDQTLATALVALAEERHPDACRGYEALLARDSADFAAWFGVGECNARDHRVVLDPRSPSGYSFRGSYQRALQAYSRALRVVPSSYLAFRSAGFARLGHLLFTDARKLRFGYAIAQDTQRMAAYPSLQNDTLAFVPWPVQMFQALDSTVVPKTRAAAVRRNREVLRNVVSTWAAAFPRSAEAHEALALGLEAVGELEHVKQGAPSAVGELATARRLNRDPDRELALSIAQVRLSLKLGRFQEARLLADSVLARWAAPGPHDAQRLVPLAVLTGRVRTGLALERASGPETIPYAATSRPLELPADVTTAYADLMIYAALGLTSEAIAAERRLEQVLRVWVEPGERDDARAALLTIPRRIAPFVVTAHRPPFRTSDMVLGLQGALGAGDTAAVRRGFTRLRSLRRDRRPGDTTIDAVLAESQVLLAAGDTAAAVEELDGSIAAVSALSVELLDRVQEAASIPRVFLLRGKVAVAQRDRATALSCAELLWTLWSGADPALRAEAERFRAEAVALR
jgi:DNA-binding SARP family transcriptional activator/tetratricopeptide (TPR) repeat protein